jgi:hypothetical protein
MCRAALSGRHSKSRSRFCSVDWVWGGVDPPLSVIVMHVSKTTRRERPYVWSATLDHPRSKQDPGINKKRGLRRKGRRQAHARRKDKGSSRRTYGNAVANPRIRVCQPSSKALIPTLYIASKLYFIGRWKDIVMPKALVNEHKSGQSTFKSAAGVPQWRQLEAVADSPHFVSASACAALAIALQVSWRRQPPVGVMRRQALR